MKERKNAVDTIFLNEYSSIHNHLNMIVIKLLLPYTTILPTNTTTLYTISLVIYSHILLQFISVMNRHDAAGYIFKIHARKSFLPHDIAQPLLFRKLPNRLH